ncbi:MAG: metal-dependent hydrolase [Chloroflexota bacterium]|nr:metal-dependent hydrolase [Chloroflexota bacterium]
MKLTYLGHAAFMLQADGQTVLVDPFLSDNPTAAINADNVDANTILLTHAHNDHVGDTVAIAKRTGATVIATLELADWLSEQGVENAIAANHGGIVQFSGGSTKLVPAWHTSSYRTANGVVAIGAPAGHVVRFGGKTTYFAGDTCLFLDMQLIGDEGLDVAVIPIGDHFTMGPADAIKAAKFLRAGIVIPCHYDTFPPIQQDADQFRSDVEESISCLCHPLQSGESLDL